MHKRFGVTWLSFLLVIVLGCSSPDEKANKLFVEASRLVTSAKEAEATSFSEAYDGYAQALEKLEKILKDVPSSQMAVKLLQDEVVVGSMPFSQLRDSLVPTMRLKAKAEGSYLVCASYLWSMIDEEKFSFYSEIGSGKIYLPKRAALMAIEQGKVSEVPIICELYDRAASSEDRTGAGDWIALAAVDRCFELGLVDVGLQLTNSLWEEPLDQLSVSILLAKHNLIEAALRTAEAIPVDSLRDKALEVVAAWLTARNRFEEALELLPNSTDASTRSYLFLEAADSCIAQTANDSCLNWVDEALKVKDSLTDDLRLVILLHAASSYLNAGQLENAVELTKSAHSITGYAVPEWLGLIRLRHIVRIYTKAERLDDAVRVAENAPNNEYRYRILEYIIQVMQGQEEDDRIDDLYSLTVRTAERISDAEERASTCVQFAKKCLRENRVEQTRRLLESALDADKKLKDMWYTRMIGEVYCELGDYRKAEKLLVATRKNDPFWSHPWMQRNIDHTDMNVGAFIGVAEELIDDSLFAKAAAVLQHIENNVKRIRNNRSKAEKLAEAAKQYMRMGNADKAIEMARQSLRLMRQQEASVLWSDAVESVVSVFVQMSMLDEATQVVVESPLSESLWYRPLSQIVYAHGVSGRYVELMRVADMLSSTGLAARFKAEILDSAARICIANDSVTAASKLLSEAQRAVSFGRIGADEEFWDAEREASVRLKIVHDYALIGNLSKALSVAGEIELPDWRYAATAEVLLQHAQSSSQMNDTDRQLLSRLLREN